MNRPEELTCKELVMTLTDYLEGAMPPDDRTRFSEHLRMCPGCRIYVDQMRRTITITGTLDPETLSPQAEEELLRLFHNWKNSN